MERSAATAALEGRYAALCASADRLSSEELLDVIELAQREKDAASARQAVALAHLSARDSHRQEDGTSVEVHHGLGHQRLDGPELAAPRMGCSVHVATNRVLDAIRQMTRTPAVVDAMATGDLDEHRARVVTEETDFLSAEAAAEVVDRVKDVWGQLTVGPLRQLVARTAAQVDPDAVAAHAEDERARRGLTRRKGVHGTDHWRGDFRVEDARSAWAAVTERARQLVREKKADSLELARADAMMELILGHCDVKVVVHTTRAADDTTAADMADSANAAEAAESPTAADDPAPSRAARAAESPTAADAPAPSRAARAANSPTAADAPAPNRAARAANSPTAADAPSPNRAARAADGTGAAHAPASDRAADAHVPEDDRAAGPGSVAAAGTSGAAPGERDFASRAPDSPSGAVEDLVEVGGLDGPGTTFVRRDWLDKAGTTEPERELTCDPTTGALLRGDVPPSLARGNHAARRAHRARERRRERAAEEAHARGDAPAAASTNTDPDPVPNSGADDFIADSYRVPDPMTRLIRLRDGSCRFPGCATPARQCDLDHVRPWPTGPTTPTNLICLCRRHHRIKQRDGWTVRLHPDGTVTWTDPTGLHRTTWPVDHLHLATTTRGTPGTSDGTDGADGAQPTSLTDILTRLHTQPTTFEDALHDLLDHHTHTHGLTPRPTRPHTWDARGRLISGPPPTTDLETGHGPPHPNRPPITVTLDHPPPPPPDPDTIPF